MKVGSSYRKLSGSNRYNFQLLVGISSGDSSLASYGIEPVSAREREAIYRNQR